MTKQSTTATWSATWILYLPKVIPFSDGNVQRFFRWQHSRLPEQSFVKCSDDSQHQFYSVIFRLEGKKHRRREFKALDHRSGWVTYGLLKVTTTPKTDYLVHAATSTFEEWADAMTLEQLFDYAVDIRPASEHSVPASRQLEWGLDCHAQLSLCHWQELRKQLLRELETELSTKTANRVKTLEDKLKAIRKLMPNDSSPHSQDLLAEDLHELRKKLLKADQTETEIEHFLTRLHAEKPTYEIQKLTTFAWSVI